MNLVMRIGGITTIIELASEVVEIEIDDLAGNGPRWGANFYEDYTGVVRILRTDKTGYTTNVLAELRPPE